VQPRPGTLAQGAERPGEGPCLHHLFELQVRRTPESVAAVCGTQRLTYRELDARADRLARRLRLLGVEPGTLVGLCVERSLDLVAGILGILKAGGAYVPLDPAYPRERLAVMLEEARVPVLVTQQPLTGQLPGHEARLVLLDAPETAGAAEEVAACWTSRDTDLAYVIFTSGSTGRPKGVMVSHRNVVRLFGQTAAWLRFGAADVWTLFHSFAFDFSVWELWGALLYGGRLVVVPHAVSRSPQDFYHLLRAEGVTVLNQTPSAFRQLIQAEELAGVAPDLALRLVIFGGEALALPALRPWFERHGDRRPQLVNMYGITETTVHVTYRPITLTDLDRNAGSVIGRPIPDLRVHLLDATGRPVPDGEVGEIYVGGAGVAAGYLNRPELTAERFPPDPFRPGSGDRLYRSGDLARRLPDGDLVYLGRCDHQVKVRGFRIELLEIETVLARHPGVRETAVLAREDEPGDRRLVAYVAARQAPAPTERELRVFLRAKLPEYMVPAAFVLLEALPMTAHGKVDRAALPAPRACRDDAAPVVAPRTDCERRLLRLWEVLLKPRPIGVRDDFFDLGGDSLLAMRLCLEIEKVFGRPFTPDLLLPECTIERLASLLGPEAAPARWSSVVAIQPGRPGISSLQGSKPPFFCVHGLGGWVLGYRQLALHLGADQPFYGLQARELHGPWEPFTRLEDMASHYISEMVQVQPHGPYYLGGYSLGAFIAFEMAQQLARQGRPVALLALLDDGPSLAHDRWRWSAAALGRFLVNFAYWLPCQVFGKSPRLVLADVCRKLRVWGRRFRPAGADPVDVEEVMDVSRYTDVGRRMLASHYRAVRNYVPAVYPGRLTLFRARTQPLLGPHLPDLGWGRLAAGGIDVEVIPGEHDALVADPAVRVLGARLARALDRARAGWASRDHRGQPPPEEKGCNGRPSGS
jgi:amino acid adenylation domain-containing protein